MRQIDCVTVKGSVRPMGLFTYDVTLEAVPLPSLYAWGASNIPGSQMGRKVRGDPSPLSCHPVSRTMQLLKWRPEPSGRPTLCHDCKAQSSC